MCTHNYPCAIRDFFQIVYSDDTFLIQILDHMTIMNQGTGRIQRFVRRCVVFRHLYCSANTKTISCIFCKCDHCFNSLRGKV